MNMKENNAKLIRPARFASVVLPPTPAGWVCPAAIHELGHAAAARLREFYRTEQIG